MSTPVDPHENAARFRHANTVDLNELLVWAVSNTPVGFRVVLSVSAPEAYLSLYRARDYLEVNTDDLNEVEAFVEHVNHARRECGLAEVNFPSPECDQ